VNARNGVNKKKKESLEDVKQNLEQAKLNGNKNQIKFWTDVLNKLKNKPR